MLTEDYGDFGAPDNGPELPLPPPPPSAKAPWLPTGSKLDRQSLEFVKACASMFISNNEALIQFVDGVEEMFNTSTDKTRRILIEYFAWATPLTYQYQYIALCGPHASYLPLDTQFKTLRDFVIALASIISLPGHFIPMDIHRVRKHEDAYKETFPREWDRLRRSVHGYAPVDQSHPEDATADDGFEEPATSGTLSTFGMARYRCWRDAVDPVPCPVTTEQLTIALAKVKQRSALWYLARRFFIGGSSLKGIIGKYDKAKQYAIPTYDKRTVHYAARLVLGLAPSETFDAYTRECMLHGTVFERMNEIGTGNLLRREPGNKDAEFVEIKEIGMAPVSYNPFYYAISPDGLVTDRRTGKVKGSCEFKCPYAVADRLPHETCPDEYIGQVIQTAFACKAPWCVYSSMYYRRNPSGMPAKNPYPVEAMKDVNVVCVTVERISIADCPDLEKIFREYMVAFAYYTQLVGAETYGKVEIAEVTSARELVQSHLAYLKEKLHRCINEKESEYKKYVKWSPFPGAFAELKRKDLDIKDHYFAGNAKLASQWVGKTLWSGGRGVEMPNPELHAAAAMASPEQSHPSLQHETACGKIVENYRARVAVVTDALATAAKAHARAARS